MDDWDVLLLKPLVHRNGET